MASEVEKYRATLTKKRDDELLDLAKKRITEEKIPNSKFAQTIREVYLQDIYKQERLKEEKRKAEWLKNNPVSVTKSAPTVSKPPVGVTKSATPSNQPPVRDIKPPTQAGKVDDVPPKLKIEKTIPVYYEKEAENVPIKHFTGVENMSRFRFRAADTYPEMMAKVNYIKAILKNKTVSQRKEILKYYEFRISIENRSNQEYYYGSKNLKNKMYRFYIGSATLK
jgi:hypothetical protein